ncbi:growth factor receptor-bound protein 2-B-like [Diadema setosum]|uniref:growth factor receptor-bound protein 2-B-like n=1 Tax=Diadema setosum TaxID=31175 RepID=UPI003B3A64EF
MVECRAVYSFKPKEPDELEFNQGDVLFVKGPEQDGAGTGWLRAQLNGREGLVPANYLTKLPSWFYPTITRKSAELLLHQEDNGAFLVRKSESSERLYSLSVKYNESVQHFRILQDTAGKFHLWIVKFPSLDALVDYYRTTSVTRENQVPGVKSGNVITLVDMQRVAQTMQKYPQLKVLRPEDGDLMDNSFSQKSHHAHLQGGRPFNGGQRAPLQNSWEANMRYSHNNAMQSMPNGWDDRRRPPMGHVMAHSRHQKLQALYDFDPEEEGELCFRKGDIITLVDKPTKDWWRGTVNGRVGMLPAPYVKAL